MKEYNAVGVIFKRAGKVYDFLCEGFYIKHGDFVVVESDKGEDKTNWHTLVMCHAPLLNANEGMTSNGNITNREIANILNEKIDMLI